MATKKYVAQKYIFFGFILGLNRSFTVTRVKVQGLGGGGRGLGDLKLSHLSKYVAREAKGRRVG